MIILLFCVLYSLGIFYKIKVVGIKNKQILFGGIQMKVNICILKKVILNKIYCLLNDMELIMIKYILNIYLQDCYYSNKLIFDIFKRGNFLFCLWFIVFKCNWY